MAVLAQEVKCKNCGALYEIEDMPANMVCLCKSTEFIKNE